MGQMFVCVCVWENCSINKQDETYQTHIYILVGHTHTPTTLFLFLCVWEKTKMIMQQVNYY